MIRRLVYFFIIAATSCLFSFSQNSFSKEDLNEIFEQMNNNPLVRASQQGLDWQFFVDNFELDNTQEEVEIISLFREAFEVIMDGRISQGFQDVSRSVAKLEQTYLKNKAKFRLNNPLKWFCPYILGYYYWLSSTDPKQAYEYLTEAEKFISSFPGGDTSLLHVMDMVMLSDFYMSDNKYDKVDSLMHSELEKLSDNGLGKSYFAALCELTLGQNNSRVEENILAIDHFEKALDIYNEIGIGESFICGSLLNELAICYSCVDGDEYRIMALDRIMKSREIIDNIGITDPEILLEYDKALFYIAWNMENSELLWNVVPPIFELSLEIMQQKLPFMSDKERKNFWEKEIDPMFNYFFPFIAWNYETGPFSYLMYYALLQTRGLQLNCNNYFNDLIKGSKDPEMVEKWTELGRLKEKYNNVKNNIPLDKALLLSTKRKLDDIEHELLYKLKATDKNILDWMTVTPEDIQRRLGKNEIAVEFFQVNYDDDSRYCALVLNNDTASVPTYIELFRESRLHDMKSRPSELGDSVWSKILANSPDVDKIYFAPCGELINFPIELCTFSNSIPPDLSLVRLSSTREIVLKRESASKEVVLFGNLNYNQSLQKTIEETNKVLKDQIPLPFNDRFVKENTGIFDLLPGTAKELDAISSYAKGRYVVKPILDGQGVECSFKKLSGKPYKIIHLATHGYFNNHGNNINTAMDNCGLAFAGVNVMEELDVLPDCLDDGKLTAAEISNMNLRGTDLVCLSACNTGRASVSSEGAFGLQRGFKLAGVNSILMSLWEIPDTGPTLLMMDSFYEHFIQSNNKYESYRLAVQEVRKQYPNFKDWASFIMIDAM